MSRFSPILLLLALGGIAAAMPAVAETTLMLRFTTGGDDLRGGNVSGTGNNLDFHFIDERGSRVHATRNANRSATWGNGSVHEVEVPDVGSVGKLRSLHLFVNGRMKADIFEEVDHWNLDALRVSVRVDGVERVLFEGSGGPLHRFTADDAGRTFPLRRIVDECATDAQCPQSCGSVRHCAIARGGPGVLRQCVDSGPVACPGGQACSEESGRCEVPPLPRVDADGDGVLSLASGGNDCDDNDGNRYPGAPEICDANGRDEDCDLSTFGSRDADRDGHVDAACFNWGPP